MKKQILVAALFMILVGSCAAQTNLFDYSFHSNSPDASYYTFMAWEGIDTLGVTIDNMAVIGNFDHDSLYAIYGDDMELIDVYESAWNGQYLKGAIIAVKITVADTLYSDWCYSKAYLKDDKIPPNTPTKSQWRE